ncbi:unnamed protein product [Paramecium sonneborni]|uniref:Uncharacterized protein n=1 Tax=Paramecium sonneborni TaxID=65129 RepID=A0A8S1LZ21_9CILI|nr:unnamed protein product [Paramecium sonneborni]
MLDNPKIQLETDIILQGFNMQLVCKLVIIYFIQNQNLNKNLRFGKILIKQIIQKNLLVRQEIQQIQQISLFLQTAIQKNNENVLFEILTYKISNLKYSLYNRQQIQQKQQDQSQNSTISSTNSKFNKRYLILSYQTDFKKIIILLALNNEEQIEKSRLMTKIENLKTNFLIINYKNQMMENFRVRIHFLKVRQMYKLLIHQ